ncbi:hypothetical protein [Lacisediminihabitans changchengi]|uniref:Uncharacterized protein n=1 Tax=Lacisediminihabitans changchengi TaxID=2787634 RepID=A0A934SR39_9MICO|nr:hypothetical protein [Lacisediminihabitans changchengi]MBK4347450.1 hypothetical protein [Lacisediminihabitans changchengi]
MPEAPRTRPSGAVVVHSFAGHLKARPRAVFEALDRRFSPGSAGQSRYLADPNAFLIVAEGGRWYRGEYRMVPDEHGSNLEHIMLNIAGQQKLSRFTGRREIKSAPAEFERLLRELRLELQ